MNGIHRLRMFCFFVLIIFLFSCDGRLVFKGYTYSTYNFTGSVSDSLSVEGKTGFPIEGAKIKFFQFLEKISMTTNMTPEVVLNSDVNGYFGGTFVIPPRKKLWGVLIVEKSGFYSDTLYFEFQSSAKAYQFNINLHALD
jgi:hypothetical protein